MKTKAWKVVLWMLAALFILLAIQWVMGMPGGPDMHAAHHGPPSFHPGYGHGRPHFMSEHHPAGMFYFIGTALSLVFWLALIAVIIGWLLKKRGTRHFNHAITEAPVSFYSYTTNPHQLDLLDEWEKKQANQTNHKEEQ
ncbi:hypothetical protein [Aneurinibacillus danicus]|jgi:4-amino-4-deoxy-L-arabinose transferase-like glycosyltransferase|uniref:Uncharacterized protein n=1 Tax=Aneurinibacillus danicus TaxID=267746 RepID=A0A511V3X3_9BACL|nr:hypothetical protein [Aneurinibacillus danicus]GEN33529.1 hypothetical protein ADA01nite_09890 [Aneurinibacillus danicus]